MSHTPYVSDTGDVSPAPAVGELDPAADEDPGADELAPLAAALVLELPADVLLGPPAVLLVEPAAVLVLEQPAISINAVDAANAADFNLRFRTTSP